MNSFVAWIITGRRTRGLFGGRCRKSAVRSLILFKELFWSEKNKPPCLVISLFTRADLWIVSVRWAKTFFFLCCRYASFAYWTINETFRKKMMRDSPVFKAFPSKEILNADWRIREWNQQSLSERSAVQHFAAAHVLRHNCDEPTSFARAIRDSPVPR